MITHLPLCALEVCGHLIHMQTCFHGIQARYHYEEIHAACVSQIDAFSACCLCTTQYCMCLLDIGTLRRRQWALVEPYQGRLLGDMCV